MKISLLLKISIEILQIKKDSKIFLSNLCDTFLLSNLISGVKSSVGSSIDVIITNKPRSFHYTSFIETGMSDCHKLILLLFRAFFKRMLVKTINYCNYRKFSPEAFLDWTKNPSKVSSTIVTINIMICFQILSQQFQIIMLP